MPGVGYFNGLLLVPDTQFTLSASSSDRKTIASTSGSATTFTYDASNYNRKTVAFTAATSVTVTVPAGLVEGWQSEIVQQGAGTVTVAAGTGVTIHSFSGSLASPGQYALM